MGAVPLQELKNNSTFFTSLYPFEFQTIQLYAIPEETVELLKSLPIFRTIPLAAQIKYLSHAAIATGVLINSQEKLFLIGDALQPFENPESLAEFHISQIGIINTAFAYYTTKRYKDLYAAMEYILENFADGEGIVRNMMSVMDLSDVEIEFQNDAGTENRNPGTEPSESASDVNAEESPEAA